MLLTLALLSCTPHQVVVPEGPRSFRVLAFNDVYRIEGIPEDDAAGFARVRTLRAALEAEGPELLVTGAGDFLFPSLLSRSLYGEQMIDVLNQLDGGKDAFDERLFLTFGNHEFDKSDCAGGAKLDARLDESQFRWLSANVRFKPCEDRPAPGGDSVAPSTLMVLGGVKVGVFGLTLLPEEPLPYADVSDLVVAARETSASLRSQGAEVVIAITHQRMADDVALLDTLGALGPDLILGGHEHDHQSAERDGRLVVKADADARTVELVQVEVEGGQVKLSHELRTLGGQDPAPDPEVKATVDGWIAKHQTQFCAGIQQPDGCLDAPIGHTQTALVAEELRIRKFETSLGDFVADTALAATAGSGAQVAMVNSGSLRLNQDLPANTDITRRHIETLFAYPAPLTVLEVDGPTLQAMLDRNVTDWTGNGHWLQIAGLRYVHDPDAGTASQMELRTSEGWRAIAPGEKILLTVPDYLATGGDGYSMLTSAKRVAQGADLKELVVSAVGAAGPEGIAPVVDGRICNTQSEPCTR